MQDKLFIDSNILIYIANESSQFHKKVLEKFKELSGSYALFISRQVVREYAVIMTRPGIIEHPLTPDEVAEDVEKWKAVVEILDETEDVTNQLLALVKKYNLKGKRIHDTNIVATMMVYAIPSLFTMNEDDFKKFDEINLITS